MLVEDDGDVWVFGPDKKRAALCRMLPPTGRYTDGNTGKEVDLRTENIANANLIAKAPYLHAACIDLLKEAKESLACIGGCDHSVGICCCGLVKLIEDAEALLAEIEGAAIAKALGGESHE